VNRSPHGTKTRTGLELGASRSEGCFQGASVLGGGLEFEGDEVAHATGRAFVFRNDKFVGAGFGIEELAVQRVGDEDCSGMKSGVHFGEGECDLVPV